VTIYDLTQAIGRHKKFLLVGFGVLILGVLVLTLEFGDGGIQWRGGLKYESSFQISVVAPGTKSLNEPETADNLNGAASAYADILASGEAAEAIGIAAGYQLEEPVSASVSRDAPIISASVIGPTPDEAKDAARSSFVWLAAKIQQPINAQPPVSRPPVVSEVILDAPFDSAVTVVLDEGLSSVDGDVFIIVDAGAGKTIAVPIADRAGSTVSGAATLEPSGSIVLNLENADGTPYDLLRLVPEPLPRSATAYPSMEIQLGAQSVAADVIVVDEEDVEVWVFASGDITTEWIPGTPELRRETVTTSQFQIAMLTDEPTALQIGGRRGPLLGFTVLIVGAIALLAAVIVADTWRRDRDAHEISDVNFDPGEPPTGRVPAAIAPEELASETQGGEVSLDVEIMEDFDTSDETQPVAEPVETDQTSS